MGRKDMTMDFYAVLHGAWWVVTVNLSTERPIFRQCFN